MSPPPRGKSGGDITKSGGDTPKNVPPRYVPPILKMPPAPLTDPMNRREQILRNSVNILRLWAKQTQFFPIVIEVT